MLSKQVDSYRNGTGRIEVNVIEYALKIEKEGEAYYHELASKAKNRHIKGIFNMLADAEVKHYEAFLQLKNNCAIITSEEDIFPKVKSIFKQMKLENEAMDIQKNDLDAYIKARKIEKESRDFYLQQYKLLSDPIEKELCLEIAEEEHQHYVILDNIISFISHPDTWVENAEWSHLGTDIY